MGYDDSVELQNWRRGKDQMLSDMGNVFNAAIELEKRIYDLQIKFNEAQWFLGEERSRRENLEKDLCHSVKQCHALRTELDQQIRDFKSSQEEFQSAQRLTIEEAAAKSGQSSALSEASV
jgi:hypothetical protein